MPARKTASKKVAKKAPQSLPYEDGKWGEWFVREKGERRYWLLKSEAEVFSFDDLLAEKNKTTFWDGVRNSAARNFLRDGMKKGDLAFFYHSMADPSAVVGICEVVREGYPDESALDSKHEYYDAESVRETPTWFMVDVRAVKKLKREVTLTEIKGNATLAEMKLLKISRLAVVPVRKSEWDIIVGMSEKKL